jgi:hypothetical protein
MKKYELLADKSIEFCGTKLFKIRALISFGVVKKGDEGGYIEKEGNLSQDIKNAAWVFKDAKVMMGGEMMGGVMRGGVMWGGEMMGGVMRGGEMRGGVMWGGEMRGGVMWGGEMRGGDLIRSSADFLVLQNIGAELGVLTAARQGDGTVKITRGYFCGTIEEFRAATIKTHGGTLHEKAYLGIANYIEFHFTDLHPFK